MKNEINKIIVVLMLSASVSASLRAETPAKMSVREVMYGIETQLHELDVPSFNQLSPEKTGIHLAELKSLFEALKDKYRPQRNGTQAEWIHFCDQAEGAVDDINNAWQQKNENAYRAGMSSLLAVRQSAHKQFRPGFLTILKRFFSKNKNNKG